ncbi:hypothetical protein CDAR_244781 [Caerostris darwini]|uniref:Uncharacterized protein n=1 Tax=Caerostris darwini TaxID=1538125 RepID=A0AAV4ML44_9ARAC|nr:hypothetical protein CDAR_244781 [Caerostris darwini]
MSTCHKLSGNEGGLNEDKLPLPSSARTTIGRCLHTSACPGCWRELGEVRMMPNIRRISTYLETMVKANLPAPGIQPVA